MITLTGKMSVFGGPDDHGVAPDEGLALVSSINQFPDLFLQAQPPGTIGLARRLNPNMPYLACRWNYAKTPPSFLRAHMVKVTNPERNLSIMAQPVDWGPNISTNRIADLSPGLAQELGLRTDQVCQVEIPEPHDADITKIPETVMSVGGVVAQPVSQKQVQTLIHNVWPLQSQCLQFYGDPRTKNWLHNNTTDVTCPWPLFMGKDPVAHILIHKKCAGALSNVLSAIWTAVGYSGAKIKQLRYDQYDGSYNFRPIRDGKGLSMHSFAAALDFDAADNEQHAIKHLFQEDSLIVTKFKEVGAIWGGDWDPHDVDAMHFQFARVHS